MPTTLVSSLLILSGLVLTGCEGPEKVLKNKLYTADAAELTVVDNEELTAFNRQGAEASETSNAVHLRFYDDQKLQLFYMGGMGIMGTYEIAKAGEDGLTAKIHIGDSEYTDGVATIESDGSGFELTFGAPIVGWKAGAASDCSLVHEGKTICTRNENDIERQTHEITLSFTGAAD